MFGNQHVLKVTTYWAKPRWRLDAIAFKAPSPDTRQRCPSDAELRHAQRFAEGTFQIRHRRCQELRKAWQDCMFRALQLWALPALVTLSLQYLQAWAVCQTHNIMSSVPDGTTTPAVELVLCFLEARKLVARAAYMHSGTCCLVQASIALLRPRVLIETSLRPTH